MAGHLYFIVGVSGSGKGTLRNNLKKQHIKNLEFIRSYVTREMRPGEINGDMYHFISKETFEAGISAGDFLEYELVHKVAYYGTKKSDIERGLQQQHTMIKEIDTKGLKQLQEKHPDFKKYYTALFLDVPSEEMIRRYLERHPEGSKDDIKNRLESAITERKQAKKYCDHIIDASKSPEQVLESVLHIMKIGNSIS